MWWWCMCTEACGTSSSERVVVGRTSSSTCLACVWRDCGDRVECGARSGVGLAESNSTQQATQVCYRSCAGGVRSIFMKPWPIKKHSASISYRCLLPIATPAAARRSLSHSAHRPQRTQDLVEALRLYLFTPAQALGASAEPLGGLSRLGPPHTRTGLVHES